MLSVEGAGQHRDESFHACMLNDIKAAACPGAESRRKFIMSKACRILLVGDDPLEREGFEKELSGSGHTVVTAASGEEALWQLAHDRYDAVVTNMSLRGMSGLEVADEIHAGQPGLPVVIIAGHGPESAPIPAAPVGVTRFLRHPLTSGKLAETADAALRAAESATTTRPPGPSADVVPPKAMIQFALRLRDIVLFLLAPFIGLVYLFTFPIVGLGALAWSVFRAREPAPQEITAAKPAPLARLSVLRTVGMLLAVLVSGIAFAVAGPILGLGLILWVSFEAWGRLGAKAMRAQPVREAG
jgi:CheY-like chemotaxis protein